MSRGAFGAVVALLVWGVEAHAQDAAATNDYYAPWPTKYDKGYGPYSAEEMKVDREWMGYRRFDLANVYQMNTDPEVLKAIAGLYARSTNQVAMLLGTNTVRTVEWTNALRRAQLGVLGYQVRCAREEEAIYKAWIEYKKPNPLSFIPSLKVRQDYFAATNRLTATDWDEIRRIESETEIEKRRKLLGLDLEKMGREITEAEISAFERRNQKSAPPPPLPLPKPD